MRSHRVWSVLLGGLLLASQASAQIAGPVTREEVLQRGHDPSFANQIRQRSVAFSAMDLNDIDVSKLAVPVSIQLQTEMFYFPWGIDVPDVQKRLGKPARASWIEPGSEPFVTVPSLLPLRGLIRLEYPKYGLTYLFHDRQLTEARYVRLVSFSSKMYIGKSWPGAKISGKYFPCTGMQDIDFDKLAIERLFAINFATKKFHEIRMCDMDIYTYYVKVLGINITNPLYEKYVWTSP